MPRNMTRRSPLLLLLTTTAIAIVVLAVGIGLTASGAFAGRLDDTSSSSAKAISSQAGKSGIASTTNQVAPLSGMVSTGAKGNNSPHTIDAFAHWVYASATPTIITVPVGTKLPMELFIDSGSADNFLTAQQSYMTYTYSVLQIVEPVSAGCVLTSTITGDTSTFDTVLQNEQCNGPQPCLFRNVLVDPGSFAFASGALTNPNCDPGCQGDFRVASMAWCASNGGRGIVHWQFSPPAPITRDTEIVDHDGNTVSDPALFTDFIVDVIGPTATATRTPTITNTPTITLTRTRTSTGTITPTRTATPCPPVVQGVRIQNFAFDPQIVAIGVGSSIQWTNLDAAIHTSTSDTNVWNSGNINQNGTFSFTFNTPGSYPYHCLIHPTMTGTIVVLGGCVGTPTPTSTFTATPLFTLTPTNTPTSPASLTPTRTSTPTITPTCPPLRGNISGRTGQPITINAPANSGNLFRVSDKNEKSVFAGSIYTDDPITFTLDDGTRENSVVLGNTTIEYAALWLNRFTPPNGSYPIALNGIQIAWPTTTTTPEPIIGKVARLAVYLDVDGDGNPANATLVATTTITITGVNTFLNYPVNITVPGPTGDIYLGFEDFWAEGGFMPPIYPASIDTTPPSRVRSWVAGMSSGAPPNLTNLGANTLLGTIDSLSGGAITGNWMIRATGNTNSGGGGGCTTATPTRTITPTLVRTNTPTLTPTRTFTTTTNTPTRTRTATVTSTSTPCAEPFTDVNPTDYFYEGVRWLYCRGAISGYGTVFLPYNNTTRGQLTKIVTLAYGMTPYTPPTPTFRDVPTTQTFYVYIETAYHNNIISGYSCGANCLEFRPNNLITRAQTTKVIALAAGWTLINPPTPTFRDVPTNHAFYTYIETAVCHQVVTGYNCGTGCLEFRPSADVTRGQIAKMVHNAVLHLSCTPRP